MAPMPCVASKHAALAAITAAATAKAAVKPLAEKIRKLIEKIARWAKLPMTQLLHSKQVTDMTQKILDLEFELEELKAGGREKRIAELEAELKKEREARKEDLKDVREAWNSSAFGKAVDYDKASKAVLAVHCKLGHDEEIELRLKISKLEDEKLDLEHRLEDLETKTVAPVPEPEPKKIPNPWGRAGKPGSRKLAATAGASPAKKARTQPARGAGGAALAVM